MEKSTLADQLTEQMLVLSQDIAELNKAPPNIISLERFASSPVLSPFPGRTPYQSPKKCVFSTASALRPQSRQQ